MKPKPSQKTPLPDSAKSANTAKTGMSSKISRWYLPVILVIAIIALLWHKQGSDDDTVQPAPAAAANSQMVEVSAAQKIASVDAESNVALSADDKRVQEVSTLLNNLSASYHENPENIANATFVAYQQLKRNGTTQSCNSILQHMSAVAPVAGVAYKQAVMAYVAGGGK